MNCILSTNHTDSNIYKDALMLRKEVFIKEQGISESIEISEEDPCIHFVYYHQEDGPIGTVRLKPLSPDRVKIQRMAVLKPYRKKGIGKQLILFAEQWAKEHQYQSIQLGAQCHAAAFYNALGYQPASDVYLEANIKHQDMKKSIN